VSAWGGPALLHIRLSGRKPGARGLCPKAGKMASSESRPVSFAAPPGTGAVAESSQPSTETDRVDPRPQPAARGHSAEAATEVPAAADGPQGVLGKNVPMGAESSTESSGHVRQVEEDPLEGASAPSSVHCAAHLVPQRLTWPSASMPHFSLLPSQ